MRKVLIALDPAGPHEDALLAAASIAGSVAELLGLFVEDIRLLRAASLPGAREITAGPRPQQRQLDSTALERQMRVLGETVRKTFEAAARRLGIQHSFRIARGEVVDELEHASRDCDLLVVARAGPRVGPRSWLGATVHRVARSNRTVVFVQDRWTIGHTILVLPTPATLALADHIAATDRLAVRRLVVGPPEGAADRSSWSIPRIAAEDLLRATRNADARALVLPADQPDVTDELLVALLRHLRCALILVR